MTQSVVVMENGIPVSVSLGNMATISYPGGTSYLRADGTWATPAGGAAVWGGVTGTLSNQADLQTALNAKQTTLVSGTDIKTINGSTVLGSGNLVVTGSDAWTYLRLAVDFTTTSNTAVDVTGLGFAPAANSRYEWEAVLMLRTATTTVNPRAGWAWPTGMTDGVCWINESQSATAQITAFGNINAALLCAVGGLPNTTQSWPAILGGIAVAGASPSGNLRVQLASETAGTTVRAVAGSFLKYRLVP